MQKHWRLAWASVRAPSRACVDLLIIKKTRLTRASVQCGVGKKSKVYRGILAGDASGLVRSLADARSLGGNVAGDHSLGSCRALRGVGCLGQPGDRRGGCKVALEVQVVGVS